VHSLYRATLFAGLAAALSGAAGAETRLASLFGSNMVIQRGLPARIWGTATPGSSVRVSLEAQRLTAIADADGAWTASLRPVPVGGPYTLAVACGDSVITLTNLLGGDVWLCSGQSNMQCPVKEVDPSEQTVVLVDRPDVRLCEVSKSSSPAPLAQAGIHWSLCTPDSARNFSAIACLFASELRKDPALAGVPIGLVDSSFGGTTCEGWIPKPALAGLNPRDLHDSMFGIKPAGLYNAMIAPLGQAAFKGVLWYQGESNSAHPETYPQFLAALVSTWRQQFAQPALPFLIVQLPDYANLWEGFYWPWIREAQAKAVEGITNTALVVGINSTEGFNLHPKEKLEIGRRAAFAARRVAYGEELAAAGPAFKEARVEGSTIRVVFDTGGDALASRAGDGVKGFAVAGVDGEYHFADARIDGDCVLVQSAEVPQPRTVRYAWAAAPRSSLMGWSGLPAAPFRTDTLPYSNVEIQTQRVTRRVATAEYEVVIDPNGMATSMLFHGAQFLSNEPGVAGGTSIPGFWGPRSLTNIRDIGPKLLGCSDDDVALIMAFEEKSVIWTITNGGKDPIAFQLALSPQVKILDSLVDGKVTLARGTATIRVEGFDTLTNLPTGPLLISAVGAGSTKSISLK
jgi:sialate O-acetylesterase